MFRLLICCIALLLPLSGFARNVELPAAIVDTEWLSRNLGAANLMVVDARLAEDYLFGHVKGAVNIPYSKLFAEGKLIPGVKEIREIIATAGIDNTSRVVIYDNGEFIWAARAFWLLQTFGVEKVALLDVGFGNWPKARLPESDQPPQVKRSNFVPRMDSRRLETKLGTRLAIDSKPASSLTVDPPPSIEARSRRRSALVTFPAPCTMRGATTIPRRRAATACAPCLKWPPFTPACRARRITSCIAMEAPSQR